MAKGRGRSAEEEADSLARQVWPLRVAVKQVQNSSSEERSSDSLREGPVNATWGGGHSPCPWGWMLDAQVLQSLWDMHGAPSLLR